MEGEKERGGKEGGMGVGEGRMGGRYGRGKGAPRRNREGERRTAQSDACIPGAKAWIFAPLLLFLLPGGS
eukprot:85747-Rhodomonas_salina.2